jgi:hypothetical protein
MTKILRRPAETIVRTALTGENPERNEERFRAQIVADINELRDTLAGLVRRVDDYIAGAPDISGLMGITVTAPVDLDAIAALAHPPIEVPAREEETPLTISDQDLGFSIAKLDPAP